MENKKVISQWDNAAQSYAANQRLAPNNLTNWEMLKNTLGNIRGKDVLDAGCGDGYFTNELKLMKAKTIGCDGSKNLIEIAKKDFKGIQFDVCDLTKTLPYKDQQFDIVVSSLTLMDIDVLDTFFNESNRILKPNGKLIFSVVHPCFFQADWEKDKDGNKLYKKVYTYYDLNKLTLNFWGETTHYHRPLEWYSKKLKQHGFYIDELRENPKDLDNFKVIKLHQKRVPLFIVISCVKKINLLKQ